ncbi:NUDIX hydrolase [Aliiroseovarius crassostreae]|uniref:NUDIX hydrolase n=1 Tax=Aliiroseovarius crassostreae TaxID=154981 RepID=UPI0022034997|nr:NUDIX hydrolase [Aliiroseovarius crassostreae]UWQ06731.1 NUDIX hydrolase [Aliiroseovarius crassostreae]
MPKPVLAVLAIVLRGQDVLLVKRKNEPDAGLWGFPGGRLEYGETLEEGACRELFEETGVRASAERFLDLQEVIKPPLPGQGEPAFHYVLLGIKCRYEGGEPSAADDALEARFVPYEDVFKARMPLCDQVADMLSRAME